MNNERERQYAAAVCRAIRGSMTGKLLFQRLYDREGDPREVQVLLNRISEKRGNPTAQFLGLCVERLPALQKMTLSELFALGDQEGME